MPALTTTDVANGKQSIQAYVTVTATLSNGTVLTKSLQTGLNGEQVILAVLEAPVGL